MWKYISRVPKVIKVNEGVISDYNESEVNGSEEAEKPTDVKQKQLAGFLFIFVALFLLVAFQC